jgi:hypothetical protein
MNNGSMNRHNSHFYYQENSHWIQESRNRTFKVNVWCGIFENYVIGPHFFEANLTGQIYLTFLTNTLSELLEEVPLNIRRKICFQNDGAPPHYHRDVRTYVTRAFGELVIERNHRWPPRSRDFTPLDFFLWSKVKNEMYRTPVETEEELSQRIIESCRSTGVPE